MTLLKTCSLLARIPALRLAGPLALPLAVITSLSLPAWGQCEQKLEPSVATDEFGSSVALDDEWAVIGAEEDDTAASRAGAAYFYQRSTPSQAWAEAQQVTASDAAATDFFGASVSICEDTAVIGARLADDLGSASGAAYVFEYVSGSWVEVAKLLAPDGGANDTFGYSVSVSGDTAVVGSVAGAYVFQRMPGLGWTFVDKPTSAFSRQVAIFGEHILAGGIGAVRAFERIGQTWVDIGSLLPTGDSDGFGISISISGDRAAIGAFGADDFGGSSGAAYVFDWNGTAWVEAARLLASDGVTDDRFGYSVSISGSRLTIGAFGVDGAASFSGAAYVFEWDGAAWIEVGKLEASDAAAGDILGISVALQGDGCIVGADEAGSGAAYAFAIPCTDCNDNQILDSTDIANATSLDCNSNGVPDECDLADGSSVDCQGNGIPDECEFISFASVYCFCDTGAPCGNADADAGCANVTGHGAAINVCGSPSVAFDDLVISAHGVLPNVSGLFYMGGGNGDQIPFGDGQRCVFSGGQGVKRFRPSNGGSAGVISLGPGIAAISEMRFGPGTIAAGRTWNFQCWYRDPIGPCGSGYNTSNAVTITFAP